jgi:hypothetical protein
LGRAASVVIVVGGARNRKRAESDRIDVARYKTQTAMRLLLL